MVTKDSTIVALLDGDVIAYRAAAIADGDGPDTLKQVVKNIVLDWTQAVYAQSPLVFMSEGKNFRHEVYPEYKQNRAGKPKPPGVDWVKEWMLDRYEQVLSNPCLEADDRLGLYATEETDEVRIIVSTDKDMRQIPALQYSPDKSLFPYRPTEQESLNVLYYQWVCGDSVDGYPGIPGMGPKKFQKWVETPDDEGNVCLDLTTDRILTLYESKGYDREYAMGQLLCACIKHKNLPDSLRTAISVPFLIENGFSPAYDPAPPVRYIPTL